MNIDVLQGSLPVLPNPGLDTLDPRWSELSGQVQDGRYLEAATQAEALLRQQVYDVRLVGYLCFGHFLEHGPGALLAIGRTLGALLDGNWEAFGPAQRGRATQQSLSWLFKQLLKQLQFVEDEEGATWRGWLTSLAPAEIDETLTLLFELQQAIGPRLGRDAPPVLEAMSKVQGWLRDLAGALIAPPPPAEPAPPAPTPPVSSSPAPAAAEVTPRGDALTVDGSYHLTQLLRKIDAFATLVEAGRLGSARIVAHDVGEILARFDPYLFFPKLFARFARLMAEHADGLAELELNPEAPRVKALSALYHVDLEEFLKLE